MINELELKKNCKNNKCKYRYFGDSAIIFTNMDTWRVEAVEENRRGRKIDRISVQHFNTMGNKTRKIQFHSQKLAYDLDYIFKNIIMPHEQNKRVFQKMFKIDELLEKYVQ